MININSYDNVTVSREKTGYAVELFQALRQGSNNFPAPCPLFNGDCCKVFCENDGINVIGDTFKEAFKFKDYTEIDKNCGAQTLKLDKIAKDIIRVEKHLIYD